MASTIKVDNVQNQPGTNVINKCGTTVNVGAASDNIRSAGNNLQASDGGNLISQSGTTITLGASGDSIALASGATQTGFGRTGTVDWQTGSIKTATFTATSGEGYFCNTTGGVLTVNLPAGSAGDIVGLKDYAGTWDSNAVTLNPNGSDKIGGGSDQDPTLSSEGGAVLLVYVDGTQGWLTTAESVTSSPSGLENFVTATGGTPCAGATSGNCKIHTFTGPGTFCVSKIATCSADNVISYVVVAGGGAGGASAGGGGGAGGFREYESPVTPYTSSPLDGNPGGTAITVTATGYPITVGAAGAAPPGSGSRGGVGGLSTFSTVTSAGGGGAGSGVVPLYSGSPGGSGGGARSNECAAGGTGNDPPTTPAQGTDGGTSTPPTARATGGGGATVAGSPNTSPTSGAGGTGATTCITASPVAYGGGGGGGSNGPLPIGPASPCGTGGAGSLNPASTSTAGSENKGGGGGGGGGTPASVLGSLGGSGVVIIRYKFQ